MTTRRDQKRQTTRPRRSRATVRAYTTPLVWILVALVVAPPALARSRRPEVIRGDVTITRQREGVPVRRAPGGRRGMAGNPRGLPQVTTTISASDGAVLQWQNLEVGRRESLVFDQPSARSIVTNQSLGAVNVAGSVAANGTLLLLSPNGVFIQPTANINAVHFVAAAGNLASGGFRAPLRYELQGSVVNRGNIRADSVTLLGRSVMNHGQIVASAGSVLMAAGDEVWLSELDSPVLVQLERAPETTPLAAPIVANSGEIDAGHQRVQLAAGDGLGLAIRNTGALRGGNIRIEGGRSGTLQVRGELDARNRGADDRGGIIELTGEKVAVQQASLDASGTAGGGTIHVGGERHGSGELRTADQVYVDAASTLRADALESGDGGEVIVWSDEQSQVFGAISARGGQEEGDGGFVETSSRIRLVATQAPDVGASQGAPGEWLIDPVNIEVKNDPPNDPQCSPTITTCGLDSDGLPFIDPVFQADSDEFDPSIVSADAVVEALERGGSVTITTSLFLTDDLSNPVYGAAIGTLTILDDLIIPDDGEVTNRPPALLRLSAADSIFIGGVTVNPDGSYSPSGDPVSIRNDDPDVEFAVRAVANESGSFTVAPQPEQGSQDRSKNPLFQQGDVVVHGEIVTNSGITAGEISDNLFTEVVNLELQGIQVEIFEGSKLETNNGSVLVSGVNGLYFDPDYNGILGDKPPEVNMNGTIESRGGSILLESQGDVTVAATGSSQPAIESAGGVLTIRSEAQGANIEGALSSGTGDLFVLGDRITIDAPITTNGDQTTGKVELQLGSGDLAVNADITTRGGEFILISDPLEDPPPDGEPLDRVATIAAEATIDTRPDGFILEDQAGGRVLIQMDGSLQLDGNVRTDGGDVDIDIGFGSTRTLGSIDAVRGSPDTEGNTIAGDVDLNVSGDIVIGADISGNSVHLRAGADGLGSLTFQNGTTSALPIDPNAVGPTLQAVGDDPDAERVGILLQAGNQTEGGPSFVNAANFAPRFEGRSSSIPNAPNHNPIRFEIIQDAPIRAASLPSNPQFAEGSPIGIDYRIHSQGAVRLRQRNVGDSLLTVSGSDFSLHDSGIDVETLEVVVDPIDPIDGDSEGVFEISQELAAQISADDIRIASLDELRIGDNATLVAGRGDDTTVGTIELASGQDAIGDLIFGGDVVLVADHVTLDAGLNSTASTRIILDDGDDATALPRFDKNSASATAADRSFSYTQDADIDDTQLPQPSQFDTGVAGMDLQVHSTNGDIEISNAQLFDDTLLSLLARDTIQLNVPINIRELEIGGTTSFQITQALIDQIQFSDPTNSSLILRAGALPRLSDPAAVLDFEVLDDARLTIGANAISLHAGGLGSAQASIALPEDPAQRPFFVGITGGVADPNVSPQSFVYRQQALISDADLPTDGDFGGNAADIATFGVRSDFVPAQTGEFAIDLDGIENIPGPTGSRIVLSGSDISLGAAGSDLSFDDRTVEIRGDFIELFAFRATAEDGSENLGRVDASALDTVRGFNFGPEPGDFDLADPGTDLPDFFEISQSASILGADLPVATAFGVRPDGVVYHLESNEGDIDLRADFARADGSALELQTNDPAKQIFLGNDHELQSLRASTNGTWSVGQDVKVTAEEFISLAAGCADDANLTNCARSGDLLLDGDATDLPVILRSNLIELRASRDPFDGEDEDPDNPEQSYIVMNGENLSFEMVRRLGVGSSFAAQQTGPIRSQDLPVAGAFKQRDQDGVTSQPINEVDLFFLRSLTGESEITNELPNIRANLLFIEALSLRIADPDFAYTETRSLLSNTRLFANEITVEATDGRIPGLDETFVLSDVLAVTSPLRFEFIQSESVVATDLPFPTQFARGIEAPPMEYAIVSTKEGGNIVADSDFSLFVDGSKLELQAGKDGSVEVSGPLRLFSLIANAFGTGEEPVDPEDPVEQVSGTTVRFALADLDPANEVFTISTIDSQEFFSPVLLQAENATPDEVAESLLLAGGTVRFAETVDANSDVNDQALRVLSGFGIQFERDAGVNQSLSRALSKLELVGTTNNAIFIFGEVPTFDNSGFVETPASDDPVHIKTTGDISISVGDIEDGAGRSQIPLTATISKYAGQADADFGDGSYAEPDLFFEAGGSFLMGEHEKLALPGGVKIRTGGTALLGDVSALVIRVESPEVELRLRAPGEVLRSDGEITSDGGVDYVANEISFVGLNGRPLSSAAISETGSGQTPLFGLPNPLDLPDFFGGQQLYPTAQAHADGADVTPSNFNNPGTGFVLDTQSEGATPADLSEAFWDEQPEPGAYVPVIDVVANTEPLLDVGILSIPSTASEYESRLRGGAIFDDVGRSSRFGSGRVRVSEIRLIADAADASVELFDDTLGIGLEHAPQIRTIFQKALDDYRALTGARRVVGFEFRRYLRNRPNSQFEAYQTLDRLDDLFRQHRRSGLVPAEFTYIQNQWLAAIQPDGITLDELSQTIFPSRYVRGSDILDVFGE